MDKNQPIKATVSKITIDYKGRNVTANKLKVVSEISIDVETAWSKVKTSALLEFITKGKVKLIPTDGRFPEFWQQGTTIITKMLLYGFIPFGGLHSIYFETIDDEKKVLTTRESDFVSKVWNHKISMSALDKDRITYTDEVTIYGGVMTGIITWWALSFYKHRHKRWRLVRR